MGFIILKLIGKMASKEAKDLSQAEHDELCCSYAALMLHDDGLDITSEKLSAVIKASGNTVEPYWPMLFAKALKSQDIGNLLTQIASAGGSGGAAAAGPAAGGDDAPKEEEKKEEEADVDMGGLFGEEDDY